MEDRNRQASLQALFEAAFDLTPEARAAYLAASGAASDVLREAEALLAAYDAARTDELLEPARTIVPRDGLVGTTVGPYHVIRELGHGGMGHVYLASRADLDKQVALKLVSAGRLASEAHVQRFLYERRVLARLEHPAIARLYDAGFTAEGVPFFAMEYVEGRPIDEHCTAAAMPIDARVDLFLDVCRAVQHAHRNLVVHRDLKPSNILVTAAGEVKLLDFGLAKLVEEEEGEAVLTQTAMRWMTPAYASPEQVRGEPVTPASDVYSLGVVLYELLSGRRPYAVSGRTPSAVERAVCEQEPAPLSVQGDLDAITAKALRKEAGRRYASVTDLMDDLLRYRRGLPVTARQGTRRYRAWKFMRRHRSALAGAFVLLGLLTGAAVREVSLRRAAETEAAKAREIAAFMTGLFASATPGMPGTDTLRVFTILDRGVARLDTTLVDQPLIQATLQESIADIYLNQFRLDRAVTLQAKALSTRERVQGMAHRETVESRLQLARMSGINQQNATADSLFQHVMPHLEREGDPALLGRGLTHLAWLRSTQGRLDVADSLLRRALQVEEGLGDCPERALTLLVLGFVREASARFDEAASLFFESAAMWERLYGPQHYRVAQARSGHAIIRRARGDDFRKTRPLIEAWLRSGQQFLSSPNEHTAMALVNLALTYWETGENDRAEALLVRAITMLDTLYPDGHTLTVNARLHLGWTYHLQGRDEEALKIVESARVEVDRRFSGDYKLRATVQRVLARLLLAKGRLDDAESFARAALADVRRVRVVEHHETADAHLALGQVLEARDRLVEAEAHLRAAHDGYRQNLGACPATGNAAWALGRCLLALGRYREGADVLGEAYSMLSEQLNPVSLKEVPAWRPRADALYRDLARAHAGAGTPHEADRYRVLLTAAP